MNATSRLFALSALSIWMAGANAVAQEGQSVNEGYPQSPENTVQSGRPNADETGVDGEYTTEDLPDDDADDDVSVGAGSGEGGSSIVEDGVVVEE